MNDELKRLITEFSLDPENPEKNYQLGCYYEDLKQYSSAGSYFLRAAERYKDHTLSYESTIRLGLCTRNLGRRRFSTKGILYNAISKMPARPEAYHILSKFIEHNENNEEKWFTAYNLVNVALGVCDFDNLGPLRKQTDYIDRWSLVFQKAHTGFNAGFIEEARELFLEMSQNDDVPPHLRKLAVSNLMRIKKDHHRAHFYHSQSDLKDVYESSLARYAMQKGGSIHPIPVPYSLSNGKAVLNASVLVDKNDDMYVNLRESNYTLYYSNRFPDKDGPMKYLYPDHDVNLRSENIICKLDDRMNIVSANKVDMRLNKAPNWFYIGLEDARLIEWNDKKYLCGVRRDHIHKGKGRMDISEIEFTEEGVIEIDRMSIPAPGDDSSYCEKNWMPILDKPFHWVKWTNPTQVVSFDPITRRTETVHLDESKKYDFPRDLKGGSQVIPWRDDYYLTLTHECIYNKNDTGRRYLQRIVVWDKDWNIVNSTRDFTMMSGTIEFVTGIAYYKDEVLISFGYEDNASYILRMPKTAFDDFVLRG